MTPIFVAQIHLFTPEAGGRAGPLPPSEWRTVLSTNGENWSARLVFSGAPSPGDTFEATAQLLMPEATQHFPVGTEFTIWEGGTKGIGHVLSVRA